MRTGAFAIGNCQRLLGSGFFGCWSFLGGVLGFFDGGGLGGLLVSAGLGLFAGDAALWVVAGFALGTAAHGIGAARALHVDADAGAYAGLALGMQVVLAALLMPLVFRLL